MKPPICSICDKRLKYNKISSEEGGDIVYFKKRKSDIKRHKHMEEIGGVGHPPEAEWFCGKHLKRAKELKDKTIDEAMKLLRKEF